MEALKSLKLVVMGDTETGKTCILQRFISDTFVPTSNPTLHAQFKAKFYTVPQTQELIKLLIWDCMGPEKYHSLLRFYYKDADAVMLVYDISKPDSFKEVERIMAELEKSEEKKIKIMIVANKKGLCADGEGSTTEQEQFAALHNAKFIVTSAKKNIRIQEAFQELVYFALHPTV